jgi:hypothetical protein
MRCLTYGGREANSSRLATLIGFLFLALFSLFCRGNSAPGTQQSIMTVEQAKKAAAVKAVDDYVKVRNVCCSSRLSPFGS